MHSNLSLASEDADCPESVLLRACGSFSDGSRTRPCEKPSMTKHCHPQDVPASPRRCPASRSGSSSDVPVLLINGVPQPDPDIHKTRLETELDLRETISGSSSRPCLPHSASQQKMLFSIVHFGANVNLCCAGFPTHLNCTQPTMKFVMDTSRFWFRPHITRAEGQNRRSTDP